MNTLQHSFKAKLRINGMFLMVCLCGVISWVSWPSSIEWWGFGFISIVMGLNTLILIIKAIGEIIALYSRDKSIAALMAQGVEVKADDLAHSDDLKSKGMIDG
jgi:uncharacterized membrane protein YadS